MRKITFLMTLLLAVFTTAMAQIDTSKEYRVKYVASNIYLNASNYEAHPTGPLGGVNFVEKAESDDQIFTFEANGTGYSLKSKSGKYIYCQSWNVDALDTPSVLTFKDAGNGEYYIMNGAKYFKVEYVTGKPVATVDGTQIERESVSGYFPYCDATSATAKFALEEVGGAVEPEPVAKVITSVDELSNSKCYTIVSSDTGRGGMYALAGKVDMCGVTYPAGSDACHGVARNAEDPAQQFAFVEYEGKHYLYSVSQKKFVAKDGDVNKLTAEGPFSYVTVGKVGDNTFSLMIDDANYLTASPGWCSNASRGTCVQTTLTAQVEGEGWDAGAWYTITEAGEFDAAEALALLAPTPLEFVSSNPASGSTVEALSVVTLAFNKEMASIDATKLALINMDTFSPLEVSAQINATDAKTVTLTLANAFKENGTVVGMIEAGAFVAVDGTSNENIIELEYNVKPVEPLAIVSVNPADGAKLDVVNSFTFTLNKEVTLGEDAGVVLYYNGSPVGQLEGVVSATDAKVVTFSFGQDINYPGSYMLYVIPGTFVSADGSITPEDDTTYNYTIEAAPNSFGNVYAAPASGSTVETLKSVTMGFMSEVASVKSDAINVTDADGNLATTATLAADDMDFNAVVVTLAEEVTKAGTYTIVVPEGFITSVSGTYNPELTLTYTIEAPAYDVKPVIEAAQAVINVRGVGYPTVESAAYLAVADAIAAAEKTPSEEAGKAIEDAVAAYKAATEGIQLPEDGKYYSITVIAKNGDKFFYNYADAKIDLAKGEEIPTTSAFLCTANKDGSYTFTTQDGKYLIYRNADKVAAWGDWTKNYITGVIDENDEELTKITIAKMLNGGNVAAASQADLFGFVTWQSVCGLKNGNPEVGYVVVKTSTTEFDGANAPFFNDNFSSAMLFQEVSIAKNTLKPVSVEPAEPYWWDTMEDIETIAINFPEEITYNEAKPVSVTFNSAEKVDVTVAVNAEDAKQLVITFPENVKIGEYVVAVPEGAVKAANGSYNPALSYTYNVSYDLNTFAPTTITPAAGEVESLKTIVLDFGPDDYPGTNGIDQETAIEVKNAMGDVVTTGKLSFHGYTGAAVTLESEITAAGLYYVIIPEGMIWNSKYENTEEKGVSKGARCNPSIELAYTIGEGATVTEVTPAPGYFEEGVPTEIAVTFSKEIKTVNFLILRTNAFGRGSYLTEDNYTIEGNKLNIKLPAEEVKYVPNATVQIQVFDVDGFPVTYAADESEVNEGFIMLTYTAPTINSLFAMASVDPAEGEVTELSTLNVTFENLQGGNDMGMGAGYVGGFDESKVVEVLDADGKQVATASMEVVMNVYREEFEGEVYESEFPTATVKFTLSQAITAAGTYTFVIPEATVYNEGFSPESEDFGVGWGAIYNPEIRLTYTIQAPSGISGVEVEAAKGNVYNLQGVRIANKLQKGVYIVNGKKVYVK